jgi:HrpA-like RNA helicase
MASLPLIPNFAHLLLKSIEFSCVAEALTAVSLLSSETIFLQPHREQEKQAALQCHKHFLLRDGDLPTLINIYDLWCKAKKDKNWAGKNYLSQRGLQLACNIREQLCNLLHKLGMNTEVSSWPHAKENFLKCLLMGLSLNIAQKVEAIDTNNNNNRSGGNTAVTSKTMNGKSFSYSTFNASKGFGGSGKSFGSTAQEDGAPYRTVRGNQPVHIHPSSVLFSMINSRKLPAFVVFADLLTTTKQYMRNVTVIDGDWLPELFPQNFSKLASTGSK